MLGNYRFQALKNESKEHRCHRVHDYVRFSDAEGKDNDLERRSFKDLAGPLRTAQHSRPVARLSMEALLEASRRVSHAAPQNTARALRAGALPCSERCSRTQLSSGGFHS